MVVVKITKSATEIVKVMGSSVSFNDSGGFFGGGSLTVQDVLDLIGAGLSPDAFLTVIGGGKGTTQNLGTLGATETIDLANANYFYGTLDQACTLSFTGWTSGKDCQITVEISEDGTGGWTPTFTGVTWIGGTPTWTTTLSTVTTAVFFSRDGGTTIYGAVVGSGGSALTIKDEGSSLATAATSLDFVGPGVTASGTGAAKTITILSTGIQLASITAASSAIAATETVVVSASLAAGSLVAGNSYRITGAGVGTTGVTPGTDTFRIRLGPTTLTGTIPTSTTALGVAAVTAQSFSFEAIITLRTSGASGTIIGECVAFSANVATGRYATLNNLSATTASVAVDTTVTNLLELTFQSGNAGSSNTFHVASIEQLTAGSASGGSGDASVRFYSYDDGSSASTGTWAYVTATTAPIYGAQLWGNTSTALNDAMTWTRFLQAGTYTIQIRGVKNTDKPIVTVKVDGSSVGTVDYYNGSLAYLQTTITGVVLASSGSHTVQVVMATKNASSSGYGMAFSDILLYRTA